MLIFKVRRKTATLLIRVMQKLRIFWYALISTNRADGSPVRHQPVQLVGSGRIHFKPGVRIGVFPSPGFMDSYSYIEARSATANIHFCSGTWINNGFRCIAEHTSITIGRNCLIGVNVEILDSDFHGLRVVERNASKPEWAAPVFIEDNVFLGSNVRVMKGVRIGEGAVIANSSVVTSDIPPNVIAAGMPAKVIRELPS